MFVKKLINFQSIPRQDGTILSPRLKVFHSLPRRKKKIHLKIMTLGKEGFGI